MCITLPAVFQALGDLVLVCGVHDVHSNRGMFTRDKNHRALVGAALNRRHYLGIYTKLISSKLNECKSFPNMHWNDSTSFVVNTPQNAETELAQAN